jgi:hypothetical protein
MKTLCLLIQVLALLVSTTLWAEPVACTKSGRKQIAIQSGKTFTINDELAISRIDTVISCKTRKLNGFEFLIVRYTGFTGGGTDGRGVTRLIEDIILLDGVNKSLNFVELNATFDKKGRFDDSLTSRCELVASGSEIFVMSFALEEIGKYFDAVRKKDADARFSALNGFAVEKFYPGKRPCSNNDYECSPHFAFELDREVIAQILENNFR